MIYPLMQRTLVVSCDKCGGELLTNAADERIAGETAGSNGWWVFDGRHFCPACAKSMRRKEANADGHAV